MNLRNTMRRMRVLLSGAPKLRQPATIVIIVVLALLAGFSIVKFLLNFDQLQRLVEESSSTLLIDGPPSNAESLTPGAGLAPTYRDPTEAATWLAAVNRYRLMVGLAPVTADDQLSRGDILHSHYLASNYSAELPD